MQDVTIHPFAEIFPLMGAKDFELLKADISANGQRDPIALTERDELLDGRNRLRACRELGIEPFFMTIGDEDGFDALAWVMSKNLHRRQLDPSQRAMCAARVASLSVGKPPTNSTNLSNYTAEQASALFGVAIGTIQYARRVIREGCVELVSLCEQGESVATACKFIDACDGKKEQSKIAREGWKAIAAKAKAGKTPAATTEEPVVEHRMEVVPPALGSADFDPGIEPDCDDQPEEQTDAVETEADPPRAAKPPKETTIIGDVIRQVTSELEYAVENLADFQVQAVYEGVRLWMAADLEKRGLKP